MEYHGQYAIVGPPGTGKTSRLSKTVQRILRGGAQAHTLPVLICSLTRTAAAEIGGRNPNLPREAVGTLHSHAYRAIGQPKLVHDALSEWNQAYPDWAIRSAFNDLDAPDRDEYEAPRANNGDALLGAAQLLRSLDVRECDWPIHPHAGARRNELLDFWDSWSRFKQQTDTIDFGDMIEIAYNECREAPGSPPIILADEAQDHSAQELRLLRKWGDAAGALIIVGDPWQALYTWRGAHPDMFDDPAIPSDHRDVLPQSYRIPASVHAAATEWIRQLSTWHRIEYQPRRDDHGNTVRGTVRQTKSTYCRGLRTIMSEVQDARDAGESIMIMATCGYMLRGICRMLRSHVIPYANPWRRKNALWNPIPVARRGRYGRMLTATERISALLTPIEGALDGIDDGTDFDFGANVGRSNARIWTWSELHQWASVLPVTNIMVRGGKQRIESRAKQTPDVPMSLDDIDALFHPSAAPTVRAIATAQASVTTALGWWWERLPTNRRKSTQFAANVAQRRGSKALLEPPAVYVGTIHSFKGGEADRVILFPDLSPKAFRAWRHGGTARDAIIRQIYVGMTRARNELILGSAETALAVSFSGMIGAEP